MNLIQADFLCHCFPGFLSVSGKHHCLCSTGLFKITHCFRNAFFYYIGNKNGTQKVSFLCQINHRSHARTWLIGNIFHLHQTVISCQHSASVCLYTDSMTGNLLCICDPRMLKRMPPSFTDRPGNRMVGGAFCQGCQF